MAVLWHEVSCILLGTFKDIFSGLFSIAIRGSRSNNHTTELLSASLLWSFCASAGDGFHMTWNYSRAQKRKKNKPQKIQPTINMHTQSFKGIAHYFVEHGLLPPVVKVKKQKLFFSSPSVTLSKANAGSLGNESSAGMVQVMSVWTFSSVRTLAESPGWALTAPSLGISIPAGKASLGFCCSSGCQQQPQVTPGLELWRHLPTKGSLETSLSCFYKPTHWFGFTGSSDGLVALGPKAQISTACCKFFLPWTRWS